jgi:hypothetical protein
METQKITPSAENSKPIKRKINSWKLFGILMVIVIVFIYLVSFVLNSAHPEINKALTKYIRLTTNQKAKLYFNSKTVDNSNGSYLGVCGSKDFFTEIQNSFSVSSGQIVCNDKDQEYALSFIANLKPDIYLCFDSSGKSIEISTNIINHTSCPINN